LPSCFLYENFTNGNTACSKEAVCMVKGISRQVIVVHSPDQKLFEQAIFILRDEAVGEGITDEMLLKSAEKLLRGSQKGKKPGIFMYGSVWACAGALLTGLAWLLTSLI